MLIPTKVCNSGQDSKCLFSTPACQFKGKLGMATSQRVNLCFQSAEIFQLQDFHSRTYLSFHIQNCHENCSSAAGRTADFNKQQLFLPCLSKTTRYQLPQFMKNQTYRLAWTEQRGEMKFRSFLLSFFVACYLEQLFKPGFVRFDSTLCSFILVSLINMSYHSGLLSPRKIPWVVQS